MNPRIHRTHASRTRALGLLPIFVLLGCGEDESTGVTEPSFLALETRLDQDAPGSGSSDRPHVVANGKQVYVVWEDQRTGTDQLLLRVSNDGGKTWPTNERVIPGPALPFADVDLSDTCLAFANGVLHVAFEASDGSGTDDAYYNRSSDGGVTWLASAVRLDSGAPYSEDSEEPRLYVEGSNVYVVWQDLKNFAWNVYFNRSSDGGLTWLPSDLRIDSDPPGTGESSDPRLVSQGSDVYVVWEDSRSGVEEIYFDRSTDGGLTWLASDVRVVQKPVGSSDSYNPKIALAGSTVCVAWRDLRNEVHDDVYFNRSADGGLTWEPQDKRLDDHAPGIQSEDTKLVCEGQRVYVLWKAVPFIQDDIYLNVSNDAGATWLTSPLRMDTDTPWSGDSDDAEISVQGNSVFVVWEDDRAGEDDIRMNYSRDGGVTWLASDERVEQASPPGAHDADAPQVASSAQGFWVTWEDERNGLSDVYVNGGKLP